MMSDYVADASPLPDKSTLLKVNGPSDVVPLCQAMTSYRQEVFRVLLLSTRNEILRRVTVSKGSLSASLVHPRDVFYPAINANAACIILVHNHPSGDPEPSLDDIELTKRMSEAGVLLGINVLDHVVVAKRGYVSLKERGVI